MRYVLASFLTLLVVSSAAAQPPVTEPPSHNRLSAYFVGSFGGRFKARADGLTGHVDARAGLGLGARYELLLGPSFSLLPTFEWLAFDLDGAVHRSHMLDFDLGLKFRKNVRAGRVNIEFYGMAPLGFSLATGDGFDNAATGFNTGALAGAMVFFKRKYGLFVEGGWRIHVVFDDGTRGMLNQGVLHVGGAIAL